jgi:hypothetical protein
VLEEDLSGIESLVDLDLYVDFLANNVLNELVDGGRVSVSPITTEAGIEGRLLSYTLAGEFIRTQRFVYVDVEREVAFNISFVYFEELDDDTDALITFIINSFSVD